MWKLPDSTFPSPSPMADSFHIPGVLGEFQLVIDGNKIYSTSLRDQKPTKIKLNDEEFEAKHYFSVE